MKTEEIRRNPDGTEERTESHSLPSGNGSNNFNVEIMEIPGKCKIYTVLNQG